MAIVKFAGGVYALLSTDSKPVGNSGEAIREIDTLREYFWSNGAWSLTVAAATGSINIFREKYVTTGTFLSGAAITIPNGRIYTVGSNHLEVWAGGLYKYPDGGGSINDYAETSTTSISFNCALPSGVPVEFTIYN